MGKTGFYNQSSEGSPKDVPSISDLIQKGFGVMYFMLWKVTLVNLDNNTINLLCQVGGKKLTGTNTQQYYLSYLIENEKHLKTESL